MRWPAVLAALAVLAWGTVSPAQAQDEEPERKECECQEWSVRTGRPIEWSDFTRVWMGNRARLGIWVDTEANEETDRTGARVTRVMEDGPADKAGIREGDIITRLAGRSLLEGSEVYDDDESAPAMRLLERARALERGDTVEVEFRRDGETRTTSLVAGDFEGSQMWGGAVVGPGEIDERIRVLTGRLQELPRVELRGPDVAFIGPQSFALRLGSSLPGLQLVSLNEDLGEYFGVDEGVLVISAPEDDGIGLKAGDVLLKIDGREVKSPSHAMRILRSYDADEEVTFEIRRKNRNQTVKGTMPERGESRVLEIEKGERDN